MKDRILILDDDPERHAHFEQILPGAICTHTYTAKQAINTLDRSPAFDVVFLDHDLPKSEELVGVSNPGTGLDVATHIALKLNPKKLPGHVWIHSHNAEGRLKMATILRRAGIPTTVQRFRY